MELTEIINSYGQTAFSMAVAWYCLTRLDKSIKENTAKTETNTAVMNELKGMLQDRKGEETKS
jgi:hypothetical protein